ncbi:DUF4143 domain-containing protein [Campylobacter concisus]|uniref:DUF4143 domain-containing protein n=1 Tax=Campylobacter concisus TaxID=199 RepID=UPI0031F65958
MQNLQLYFNNALKRLIKTPKIFTNNIGVLAHLLQISSTQELANYPYKGAIMLETQP